MKRSGPTHFKTERLMKGLGLARYEAVGILELLWHFADTYAPDGNLSPFLHTDLALAVGWQRSADELVTELVAAGFLDQPDCCENHTLLLHDRAEHAQDYVKKNMRTRLKQPFAEPCPESTSPDQSSPVVTVPDQSNPDGNGQRPSVTGNAAMPNADAESPRPPSTESEQPPSAPRARRAPDIWDEKRRTGEVSGSAGGGGVCSDSDFERARAPPPEGPDPREVDALATRLADLLKIQHLDELVRRTVRWRQAKTDRNELVGKICPAILAAANGTAEWAVEQAIQSATADRPMAVFKKRLQKRGVIESVRKGSA